ncbi:hypothetical protein KAR91_76200, partial [Candidatus Pacearchaeota archaeon]|nr:hypothetical protein [Candidatus Pacearchaeota archaeon]
RKGDSLIRDIASLDQRLDNQTSLIDHLHRNGSVIIPEVQAGTEFKDNGHELQYERSEDDSIGLEFKTPANDIMSDIRLERDQTISIIQEISRTKKDDKVKPVIGVLSEYLDQEAQIKSKVKTLEEGYRKALSLLAWLDDSAKSNNLDKYQDIIIKFDIEGLTGNEIGETVDAYSLAIKPAAPLVINQELYRAMVKQLLNNLINANKMQEIDEEVDGLDEKFFLSFTDLSIPDA